MPIFPVSVRMLDWGGHLLEASHWDAPRRRTCRGGPSFVASLSTPGHGGTTKTDGSIACVGPEMTLAHAAATFNVPCGSSTPHVRVGCAGRPNRNRRKGTLATAVSDPRLEGFTFGMARKTELWSAARRGHPPRGGASLMRRLVVVSPEALCMPPRPHMEQLRALTAARRAQDHHVTPGHRRRMAPVSVTTLEGVQVIQPLLVAVTKEGTRCIPAAGLATERRGHASACSPEAIFVRRRMVTDGRAADRPRITLRKICCMMILIILCMTTCVLERWSVRVAHIGACTVIAHMAHRPNLTMMHGVKLGTPPEMLTDVLWR